jgi:membrane fusion protein (multidrug efflux system)
VLAVILVPAACDGANAKSGGPGAAGGSDAGAAPPPLVRVAPVSMATVQRAIETTSYLESEHSVAVLSKTPGRVAEVVVDEGQHVQKGQPLASLDDREAKALVEQARVQAVDRVVRRDLAKLEVEASSRRVEQARIERDRAKLQYERNAAMDKGLISPAELDESKFALDTSEEALRVAEFNQRKATLEVEGAENAIAEQNARLEAEQLRLAEHRILAPIDGVIERCGVRGGETIGTSTELFTVVDQANLVAYLRRPQRELALVQGAREVTFTCDGHADRVFRAGIDVISPVVDASTGSFRVRIRIDPADAAVLRPGLFIRARILTEDARQALMVPKAAIINEADRSIVFVVRDGLAHRVVLDPGLEERDRIECRNMGEDGLAPGDRVVVSGQAGLDDRVAVEVSEQ